MVRFPNAKINLGLFITEKRTDSYHNIESLMLPVPLCDVLEIVPINDNTFKNVKLSVSGNPVHCPDEDNLCVKAYHLLADKFSLPSVQIYLHKVIPDGAGLGGGSSDAASALLILNDIFSLNLNEKYLEEYASELGSDCAFFIKNNPAFCSGRGEIMEATDFHLKGWHLMLVFPPVKVSTKDAYAGCIPDAAKFDLRKIQQLKPEEWKEKIVNDFEKTVFEKYPLLKEIRDQLYDSGAVYAAMSGSGSTIYGLYDKLGSDDFSNFSHYKIIQL
ncbi:MAG: 4-(cytidine 5'-diphospho)-2-C-methyl-D-erythritol kinase [Bacteroidota bacterium]